MIYLYILHVNFVKAFYSILRLTAGARTVRFRLACIMLLVFLYLGMLLIVLSPNHNCQEYKTFFFSCETYHTLLFLLGSCQ